MDPTDLTLVLGVAAAALAVLVFGPGLAARAFARGEPPSFLGPLFWAEWQRLHRRGTHLWLRVGYVGVLLLGLLAVHLGAAPADGELSLDQVARLAESYFHLFLWLQFLALTVATPVIAAASVFEEQERRTLDLLLSSLLTRREIVTGKLAARVAFVLSVAAAGLPVLALTLHFGGVDGGRLACAFVVTVFNTAGLAAYTFWFVTRVRFAQSVAAVLAFTFGSIVTTLYLGGLLAVVDGGKLGITAGVSPFLWLLAFALPQNAPSDLLGATVTTVLFHAGVALVCGAFADPRSREVRSPRRRPPRRRRSRRFPRVDPADPLGWKEKYFTVRTYWDTQPDERSLLRIGGIGCGGVLAVSGLLFLVGLPIGRALAGVFGAGTFLLALAAPAAGLLLTACVARERRQQTLESLLSLPYDWDELLAAKWQVADLFLRPVGILYAVAAITVFVCLTVHPVAAGLAALVLYAEQRLFLALGLWLSVRCRSPVRAAFWCLTAAFAAFLLPYLLAGPVGRIAAAVGWPAWAVEEAVASLSPAVGANLCLAPLRRDGAVAWLIAAGGAAVVATAYLLASVWLWRHACRTFGRGEWS